MTRVLAWLTLSVSIASAGVISDVDDTVKITHVDAPLAAIGNGIASRKAFAGSAELFRRFETEVTWLSSSPSELRGALVSFLQKNEFPLGTLITRNALGLPSSYRYKTREIREILSENPGEPFLLVGDDTQADPRAYATIVEESPDAIEAVYIRSVNREELPSGQVPFFTAFDVALHEAISGRMDEAGALAVADSVIADDDKRVLPKFAACPDTGWLVEVPGVESLGVDLQRAAARVELRVSVICSARDSD